MSRPTRHSRRDVSSSILRFLPYLVSYWPSFAGIFVLLLVVTAFELVRPWIIGRVVDSASQHEPWANVLVLLGIFLFAVVGKAISMMGRNILTQRTGMRVVSDLRVDIFRHLQNLSIRFYDGRHTGSIVSRISMDTGALHSLITGALVNIITDVVTILAVLFVLLRANWQLAILSYAVLPFFVVNYLWHKRRFRVESRRHRRNWDGVMSFLHERISSTRLVRAFAAEQSEIEAFRGRIEADFNNYNRVIRRVTFLSVGADFLAGLGTLMVLGYGAWLVLAGGGLTVGELTAFLLYLGMLFTPITRIIDSNAVIQQAATSLEKIFTLLDTQPHVPGNDQLPELPHAEGRVTFENVGFAYRAGHTTLEDVDFNVRPGEVVALVGPSGSGKSTIITLLARFYDPSSGRILVDGRDIRDFNVQSLRRQIGIVMQDNILFSGTIAENIAYGRPGATRDEIIAAAQAANAHDFVEDLPLGYETWLGERGVNLSGGQRQRVAIARVIIKDPRILILDEATSALDTKSERLVQEALERLMTQRTAIVIAHRLSTVVNADTILVLDHGRIVERGAHDHLLRQRGLYARLHELQFSKAAESADS